MIFPLGVVINALSIGVNLLGVAATRLSSLLPSLAVIVPLSLWLAGISLFKRACLGLGAYIKAPDCRQLFLWIKSKTDAENT